MWNINKITITFKKYVGNRKMFHRKRLNYNPDLYVTDLKHIYLQRYKSEQ